MQTQELKDVVGAGLTFIEAGFAVADGLDVSDVGKALEALKKLPELKKAPQALAEYKAMNDEQAKDLEDFVITEFDISDDKVEVVIETVLNSLIGLHSVAALILKKDPAVVPV